MTLQWPVVRGDVEKHFHGLSGNTDLVGNALSLLGEWLSDPICEHLRPSILAHIEHGQFPLLLDSFYQLIPFGTGGRRGRVGYGPNRINDVTVAQSVQGHCNYLHAKKVTAAKIVVACDTRFFADLSQTYQFLGPKHPLLDLTSRALASIATEIYAANGFQVFLYLPDPGARYLSTPELSFAIRFLGAAGGINVSASHNHPDDNGFKFYNTQAAQDIPPTDQELTTYMQGIKEIRRMPLAKAIAGGLAREMPAEVHPAYLGTNLALPRGKHRAGYVVGYTPLCGTGDGTVGDVLRAAGYDVRLYGPQANFDGTFASIPFRLPNPEVPESSQPALPFAKEQGADLLLCTDPDADRIGVYAQSKNGQWRYFTGNEIAAVLAYYLLVDKERGPKRTGFVIKTLVTTRLLDAIAAKAGSPIVADLLVGFKYIADVLHCLERDGHYKELKAKPQDLVVAAEESHGVLLTPAIRDKDAAGGALMLCDLMSALRQEGKYLPDYLATIMAECGNYRNVARSIVMRGIRGSELLSRMMKSLRDDPPSAFAQAPVRAMSDYLSSEFGPIRSDTDTQSRNLLAFRLDDAQIVIRPSGTEPKVKVYVDFLGKGGGTEAERTEANRAAQRFATGVVNDCTSRIGITVSESASRLPDYIDLDLKVEFDTAFRRDLQAAAGTLKGLDDAAKLDWLRKRLAPCAAGSDPLDAVRSAVDGLCNELGIEDLRQALAAKKGV